MTRYERINIGDSAELEHTVTKTDIDRFVELTGDDNPLHVDEKYAATTAFKKPVVHGMLGASFLSTIIGTKLPGEGALWFSQSLEFLRPVRVGDRLTVRAVVTAKHDRMQAVELATTILNQDKQEVLTGTAKVKIVEQEKKDPAPAASVAPKTALVIGGTGGIGRAACLRLAAEGYDVAVHYHRNEMIAETLREEIERRGQKALAVSGDITNPEAAEKVVRETIRKLGSISVLVNCSTARLSNVKFSELDWSSFEDHFSINVKGNFNLLRHILPRMKENKAGSIVFLSTQAAEATPPGEWAPYVTAKCALAGFAKALAVEMAPFGIRVNSVSPGMTDTDLIADIPEKARLLIAAKTPLKRLASVDDVADAIVFLASERSKYVTGETVRVNGGQVML